MSTNVSSIAQIPKGSTGSLKPIDDSSLADATNENMFSEEIHFENRVKVAKWGSVDH